MSTFDVTRKAITVHRVEADGYSEAERKVKLMNAAELSHCENTDHDEHNTEEFDAYMVEPEDTEDDDEDSDEE